VIGYAIIIGSGILKVPQIFKIINNKSVQGISKYLFYMENFVYLHTTANSMHKNIPFSVYGENGLILCQNYVIIMLIWAYDKSISIVEKVLVFGFFAAYNTILV